jgi:hypothetical protein
MEHKCLECEDCYHTHGCVVCHGHRGERKRVTRCMNCKRNFCDNHVYLTLGNTFDGLEHDEGRCAESCCACDPTVTGTDRERFICACVQHTYDKLNVSNNPDLTAAIQHISGYNCCFTIPEMELRERLQRYIADYNTMHVRPRKNPTYAPPRRQRTAEDADLSGSPSKKYIPIK